MEGISHEAASMAGHLKLGKLIVLFDDNEISIDGPTSLAESDDTLQRFDAYGWDTMAVDGHDNDAVAAAIEAAHKTEQPSLIACRSIIGYGAPNKQGTAATHGAALGHDEVAATRDELGWPHEPFDIPRAVVQAWRKAGARGAEARTAWLKTHDGISAALRHEFDRRIAGDLPGDIAKAVSTYKQELMAEPQKVATRKASELALNVLIPAAPEMIGGSADLTGSNNTRTGNMKDIAPGDFAGRYVRYGVREHAMAAAMSGMALHRGIIPYGGTFLVFTDYCRPSIRLAALMEQRVIYVMTHDSIGLGEDGPTHQPVEHLASLRAMPNLNVFRPADVVETLECWQVALKAAKTPSVLALTRQGVPQLRLEPGDDNPCARGGYVLRTEGGDHKATIVATGSEVSLACEARDSLEADGIGTRVVSMPCWELFADQDDAYRANVMGNGVAKVGVEAASGFGWQEILGGDGGFVGMTGFGASAPAGDLYNHFGITAEAVVAAVKQRV